MASLKDVDQLASDLDGLVGALRAELKKGPDFGRLVAIADEISEHADNAAQTFSSVDEALTARLQEINGTKRSSGSQSRQSQASAS
jgi:hypothetical protein